MSITSTTPSRTDVPELDDALIRFRSDVVVEVQDGVLQLLSPVGSFALRGIAKPVIQVLRGLAESPLSLAHAAEDLSRVEAHQLRMVAHRVSNLFVRHIVVDNTVLATIEATARDARYEPTPVTLDAPVRLSKFALLRMHADALVLESPLVKHRVTPTIGSTAAAVSALGTRRTGKELVGELSPGAVSTLLAHLVGAGFVEVGQVDDETITFPSDREPTLRQWDFHDLLSHSRARSGRFDQPFGGIFPYRGEIAPQPAAKPVPAGRSIPLHRPSLEQVLEHDPALTTVLEGRTSVRQYDEKPLSAEQIGEFLYRTARVRAGYGPSEATPYEATTRPYPCGGAAYELELYLTVRRCEGLAPGAYYYDPVGHRLIVVNDDASDCQAMLHTASVATGMQANPDVLITMTSRFQRLSWKYRAIAYSVSLKHAGVLYQTMYLVATAMGLAPCGLGSGDADQASRVLGLDYLTESSVGDFILGSRPVRLQDGAPPPLPDNWRAVNDPQWGVTAQATLRERRQGTS